MSQEHFSYAEIIKQLPSCAFQMQKGSRSLRDEEKLFPSFITFYTTLKVIKGYNKTSLFARQFEAYQSVFCQRSNLYLSWLRCHKARIGIVGCLHSWLKQFRRHFQKTKTPTTNNFAKRPNPYLIIFSIHETIWVLTSMSLITCSLFR